MKILSVAPGVILWREKFTFLEQQALLDAILAGAKMAPFYRPVMPGTGQAFSVEETNLGTLGWVADKQGYRYQSRHPVTGVSWPAIPKVLLDLWDEALPLFVYSGAPQCCLVNLYRTGARMGLHQDRDEAELSAPVISVSLGDTALFRIGGPEKRGSTQCLKLTSGDVVIFGGPARLAYHGIDRILTGSSTLVPGGGRINLTLRRVR